MFIEPHARSDKAETNTGDTAAARTEARENNLVLHPLAVPRLSAELAVNLDALAVAVEEAARGIEGAIDLLTRDAMGLGFDDLLEKLPWKRLN